jgi:hypothetical protein
MVVYAKPPTSAKTIRNSEPLYFLPPRYQANGMLHVFADTVVKDATTPTSNAKFGTPTTNAKARRDEGKVYTNRDVHDSLHFKKKVRLTLNRGRLVEM